MNKGVSSLITFLSEGWPSPFSVYILLNMWYNSCGERGNMILYHGTTIDCAINIVNNGIDFSKCNLSVDFGKGFYMTENKDLAKKWANRKSLLRKKDPAIVIIEFDEINSRDITVKFNNDQRWGQFVINNRNGADYYSKISFQENNRDGKYDITYGRIADVEVVDIAEKLAKSLELLADYRSILNLFYPSQWAIHTAKGLEFINIMNYEKI